MRRNHPAILAAVLAAMLCLTGAASALDYDDVVLMKENGIADTVIVNMIQDGGGMALTTEQEARLRGMGVSEAVLDAARVALPEPAAAVTVVEEPPGPIQVTEMAPLPARYAKEGWISLSNTGWELYYVLVDQKAKRIFLSQAPNGGMEVYPGQNIALNLRKETYKMYGSNGEHVKVKVRENEVTRITLAPFGAPGGGGLTASVQDRERVRSEVLFGHILPAPRPVVVETAPVFVHPGPVIVPPPYYRRYHRPPYYHRGPGFGYSFGW